MPSLSPSPAKRPSIDQRTSSAASLSSSSKAIGKASRTHAVGAGRGHVRNLSHGKNLTKLGKINSSTNLATELARNHQRKKSAPSPPTSPRGQLLKRNSSHVVLPKNPSHVNLRKNHSASTLARNVSHVTLKKIGLAPPVLQKSQENQKNQEIFDLGDNSSEEEDGEGEWEDSANQSPELTRDNSRTSTPVRLFAPTIGPGQGARVPLTDGKTSSPPAPSPNPRNRSLPDLTKQASESPPREKRAIAANPSLLQPNTKFSRAPPAMSTVSAKARSSLLSRNDSKGSFDHITHDDANSSFANVFTPSGGKSSSADVGISHFVPENSPARPEDTADNASDDDEIAADLLSNYHPLTSQPETLQSKKNAYLDSRTQQRLELQRREAMRPAGTITPTTPPLASGLGGLGYTFSSGSLHGRSVSRGRARNGAGATGSIDIKAMTGDYDAAMHQLKVVQRFRNPHLESLNRLKANGLLPGPENSKSDDKSSESTRANQQKRPPSRRGQTEAQNNTRSTEHQSPQELHQRPGNTGRVQFGMAPRSQSANASAAHMGSSEDLAAFETSRPTSSGADDDDEDDDHDNDDHMGNHHHIEQSRIAIRGEARERGDGSGGDGAAATIQSREEAMVRRLWESRDVFDRPLSRLGSHLGSRGGSGVEVGGGLGGRGN